MYYLVLALKKLSTSNVKSFLLLSISTLTIFGSMVTQAQTTSLQTGVYKVASETINVNPENSWYYYFYANSPASNIHLVGQYQELNGNDIIVTIYDDSSCTAPYGSPGFELASCATIDSNIFNKIGPAGVIDVRLYPGNYFLTFESANYNDVMVNVNFDVKYNFLANTGEQPDDGIADSETEEVGDDDGVGCLQGPGGCGGAFDLGGFGPFSPLNPNFGQ